MRRWENIRPKVREAFEAAEEMHGCGDPELMLERKEKTRKLGVEVLNELRKLRVIDGLFKEHIAGLITAQRFVEMVGVVLESEKL